MTKQVHSVSFDFLYIEMVDYVIKSSSSPEHVLLKLEQIGFRVGQRLVEREAKDKSRFRSDLEVIKFLCKDFWFALYNKSITNLKTNHKGTFMLTDDNLHWLKHLPSPKTPASVVRNYVVFPCGIIRGALANLGVTCTVTADTTPLPPSADKPTPSPTECRFTIKIESE